MCHSTYMGHCKHWSVWFATILLVFQYNRMAEAIQSDTCWDGSVAVDYTGTISITSSGITCQSWAADTPQDHNYHGSIGLFPYDGDDVAASNYCRDPDGDSGSSGPWCFTMDPTERYGYCDIPLCYNLVCSDGVINGQSNPSSVITRVSSRTGTIYLQKNSLPNGFTCCGTIKQWLVYIKNLGTVRLQVWRYDSGSGNYVLMGENVYSYSINGEVYREHHEGVSQPDRISVQEGDLMGWYTEGIEMVPYLRTGADNPMALLYSSTPVIGDYVDYSGATVQATREYAIGAELAASIAPYFDTTVTSIDITSSESIGNTIHTLTVTDDDTYDVSSLIVSLATSDYFDLNGTDVIVKSNLVTATEILNFTVTDQCSQTGVFSLTVTVTGANITSLPVTANASEWLTAETLIHTLVIDPTGTYTCTLDSYTPTRTEGNPFIVKTTPSSDLGIYLMAAANILYNVATSYNVTITCTNAVPVSTNNYIIIDVNPSSQPVFSAFQSSLTIDTATASIHDIVYTASVTDTDGYNSITMYLMCDPSSSEFIINNNGEISITIDPSSLSQAYYTFILTADDGFNSVTSSNISVIITNLNVKSVITNLPTPTQSVLENQAAGTLVFSVSQSDANGDTPTFDATYSSTACVNGNVVTLESFDYESGVSCTLTITVFDGTATSDPETLTIDIGDVDEPPVMSNTAYVISTDEVASGTTLQDAGISATDPEGAAVSFSLSCSYLTIDNTSGIVTMTTSFDIDTSATNPYTISCVVTATDATGQTSTATLDVIVSDGNDIAPVFTQVSYTLYIYEGHTGYSLIDSLTATDDDVTSPNNAVTYSITPTTSFSIGGLGNIQNTVDLSGVASGTTYTLTATATDGGTPPLSNTATVVISVLSNTATTTVAATTAGPTTSSGDTSSGFFSDTGHILVFAFAAFTAAVVSAVVGFLIWKHCRKPQLSGNRPRPSRISPNVNNNTDYPQKGGKTVANKRTVHPREPYYTEQRQNKANNQTLRSKSPRSSPSDSERPDSENSIISGSQINASAVKSVRRTNLLSDYLVSPRSTSKSNLYNTQTRVTHF